MPEIITDKPALGVSACLHRCPVRYNGKSLDALSVLGRERADFTFVPVCPECMSGCGVPRPPIHLEGTAADIVRSRAKVRNRYGRDVTDDLIAGSRVCPEALRRAGAEAVILKEESPSCALERARIGKRARRRLAGPGVFAEMLKETGWFLLSDRVLANPLLWWDARRRLHAWIRLHRVPVGSARDLYDAWHVVKFVVQEIDRSSADSIGRELAGPPRRPSAARFEVIRSRILDALRRPSTAARIRQALWKTYVHAVKRGTLEGVDPHDLKVSSPEVRRNADLLARELTTLERISFENDMLFGTRPVIRRDMSRLKWRDAWTP